MGKLAEYDSEAETYDTARFCSDLGRRSDYMHKKIVAGLIDSSGKTLLEIGVGTGRFGTWLAKENFKVIGIDISRRMLKKAKEKARLLGVDLDLVLANVHNIPFRSAIFDNCICINVIDHFSDYAGFFEEVRQVVKPEACFVFNFSNTQSPYLPVAVAINVSKHALFKSKIFSKWSNLKEIHSALSQAGFQVNDIRGCMIASQIPFENKLATVAQSINCVSEKSLLRFFSGSIFLKAKITSGLKPFHK